jgi:ABC-type lipoprotein release transport system permease subunit
LYRFILAFRYLRARKITYFSILGVAVGVTALIVVLSVMEGFQRDFKGRIRGMLSDILFRYRGKETLEEDLRKIETVPHVTGAAPRLRGMALVGGGGQASVETVGIDPTREGTVSDLATYVMNAWLERPAADAILYIGLELDAVMDYLMRLREFQAAGKAPPDWSPARLEEEIKRSKAFARSGEKILEFLREHKSFSSIREAYLKYRRLIRESQLFGDGTENLETAIDGQLEVLKEQEAAYERAEARAEREGIPPLPFSSPTANEIVVGEELATRHLRIYIGEKVQMVSGSGKGLPTERGAEAKGEFEVVGTFKSKMYKYDARVVFMPLKTAQVFQGREGLVSEIGVRVDDFANAQAVKAALKAMFPGEDIRTWAEHRKALLQAIHLEKAFLAVILFMIVVVAGFNMLATYLMMVAEKTRDLGILKALGGKPSGITLIFLLTCTLIGAIGAGLGTGAGLLIATYINEIETFAVSIGIPTPFPRGLYYLDRIPVVVEGGQIFWIVAPTILLSVLLGGVIPALKAARMNPLDALRHE